MNFHFLHYIMIILVGILYTLVSDKDIELELWEKIMRGVFNGFTLIIIYEFAYNHGVAETKDYFETLNSIR